MKEWEIYDSDVGTLHLQSLIYQFVYHLVLQDYKLGDTKVVYVIVR
jgi:hypothetical protein